jgi:hypothetical protein
LPPAAGGVIEVASNPVVAVIVREYPPNVTLAFLAPQTGKLFAVVDFVEVVTLCKIVTAVFVFRAHVPPRV